MEKKILKLIPRRSPRLLAKYKRCNDSSTSMQDLNLPGSNSLLGSEGKMKHSPSIRTLTSECNLVKLEKQRKALKRMRKSTLLLCSIENVMPTPLKRVKSSSSETVMEIAPVEKKEEPVKKKFTSKVVSFARGLSPKRSFRKRSREDLTLNRSSSLRLPKNSSNAHSLQHSTSKKYKQLPTPTRHRNSLKLWVDSVASIDSDSDWTPQQIKRQEAIYELYCSETDLVEDLKLLQEVYFNPVSKLKLLSDDDLASIFGSIQVLLPLHEDLVRRLEEVRETNGSIDHVGQILIEWIPTLRPYIPYCANQLQTREILLRKIKENKQFSDFLQRCLESPFSRKLDLWSFLDSPRSKLVKYPLLVSNIHKYTPKDHADITILYRTNKQLETFIHEADRETGISKCAFYKERLYFLDHQTEYKDTLNEAKTLMCHGCLKNKSGHKLEAFLFDTIFICTRLATRSGTKVYQVFSQPVVVCDMNVVDLSDGEVRLGGSFRTTLTKGPAAKHAFRVFSKESARTKSIVLQANDQHDKKQWLNAFYSVVTSQPDSNNATDLRDHLPTDCNLSRENSKENSKEIANV